MTDCPVCGAVARADVVAEGSATLGPVTVRIAPVPVVACDAGHLVPRPDLGDGLVRGVRGALTVAGRAGLRRREVCGHCRADLALPPRTSETPVPVEVIGGVVTVTLEAPMVRCPDCGVEQLPRGVDRRLDDVVDAALRFAVAPPG